MSWTTLDELLDDYIQLGHHVNESLYLQEWRLGLRFNMLSHSLAGWDLCCIWDTPGLWACEKAVFSNLARPKHLIVKLYISLVILDFIHGWFLSHRKGYRSRWGEVLQLQTPFLPGEQLVLCILHHCRGLWVPHLSCFSKLLRYTKAHCFFPH